MDKVRVYFDGLGLAFDVNRVAFSIGGKDIYWYGIIIAAGFLIAMIYAIRNIRRFGIEADRMIDVAIGAIIGGVIGARIYYVIFALDAYKGNFWKVFAIWEGGLAIYGGIIGAFLDGYFLCRWRKVNFRAMADMASVGLLIGQGIGRWGNFINQEAFGSNTTLPWGMFSDETAAYLASVQDTLLLEGITVYPNQPVHPCFLYESLWCLIGALLLYLYINKRRFDGEMIMMYCAWYGFGRFFIEGVRTDSLMIGMIRVSQLVSAIIFIAAIVIILAIRSKIKRSGDPEYMKLYCNTEESIAMLEEADRKAKEEKEKRVAKKAGLPYPEDENVEENEPETVEDCDESEPETEPQKEEE